MPSELKSRIQDEVKSAMRARAKARLETLRLVTAAIKQREVDERIELEDADVLAILEKMLKQRRESIATYEQAGRQELADKEHAEVEIIGEFMPRQLDESEIGELVDGAVAETGAASMRDMGKVMGVLKPKLQGRADMSAVSAMVKAKLAGG